jgi:hypothetical protein
VRNNPFLLEKLDWLTDNVKSRNDYVVEVDDNEDIGPQTLSYNKPGVSIRLTGIGSERTITLSSNGSLFAVGLGVTLIIDKNITLKGRSSNDAQLVIVNRGGTLIMKTGAAITGNIVSTKPGAGVFVNGGNFMMDGGTITGNTASGPTYGGGTPISSPNSNTLYGRH